MSLHQHNTTFRFYSRRPEENSEKVVKDDEIVENLKMSLNLNKNKKVEHLTYIKMHKFIVLRFEF